MTAAYVFVLASLIIERLTDPLILLPAVLAGFFSRSWRYVAIAAAAIAAGVEAARYVNNFQPALLAVTWASAAGWGSLAYLLKRQLVRRRTAITEKAP
jgi:hypothetical protein